MIPLKLNSSELQKNYEKFFYDRFSSQTKNGGFNFDEIFILDNLIILNDKNRQRRYKYSAYLASDMKKKETHVSSLERFNSNFGGDYIIIIDTSDLEVFESPIKVSWVSMWIEIWTEMGIDLSGRSPQKEVFEIDDFFQMLEIALIKKRSFGFTSKEDEYKNLEEAFQGLFLDNTLKVSEKGIIPGKKGTLEECVKSLLLKKTSSLEDECASIYDIEFLNALKRQLDKFMISECQYNKKNETEQSFLEKYRQSVLLPKYDYIFDYDMYFPYDHEVCVKIRQDNINSFVLGFMYKWNSGALRYEIHERLEENFNRSGGDPGAEYSDREIFNEISALLFNALSQMNKGQKYPVYYEDGIFYLESTCSFANSPKVIDFICELRKMHIVFEKEVLGCSYLKSKREMEYMYDDADPTNDDLWGLGYFQDE